MVQLTINRKTSWFRLLGSSGLLVPCAGMGLAFSLRAEQMNVLFIAVDDLRPDLGCYGNSVVQSLNIDRLASQGTVFNHAYCQWAVCGPSRASILSGMRPDSSKIYYSGQTVDNFIPDVTTLPGIFKQKGYQTSSFGKIYHHFGDDAKSWSIDPWRPAEHETGNWEGYITEEASQLELPVDCADVPDDEVYDGRTINQAIAHLQTLGNTPFFMAVGMAKPHLPFSAPKKYWDLYDRSSISTAIQPDRPSGSADVAYWWSELADYYGYTGVPTPTAAEAQELVHGYLACVSFIDAQIGKLLDELERMGLAEKTIVVLWGDHGFHLGDQGVWGKHTDFERAAWAPLIVSIPGQSNPGVQTDRLVELVDIYPTLVDACGFEFPQHLEGTSLLPLMNNPQREWKSAVFNQYQHFKTNVWQMGYSVRTEQYRYIEWQDRKNGNAVLARELYDIGLAPPFEQENLADSAEYESTVLELSQMIRDGWEAEVPVQETGVISVNFYKTDTPVVDTAVFSGVVSDSAWEELKPENAGTYSFADVDGSSLDVKTYGGDAMTGSDNAWRKYPNFTGIRAANGDPATVTLSDIPYDHYYVIFYLSGWYDGYQGKFSDGTITKYADFVSVTPGEMVESTDIDSSDGYDAGSYVVFGSPNAPLTSNTLTLSASKISGAVAIGGFQVVGVE